MIIGGGIWYIIRYVGGEFGVSWWEQILLDLEH
jgi:hypothetical protein